MESPERHAGWTNEEMAARVAADCRDGYAVNLGIGLPTLVANYIPADREVLVHSENGILGMGPRPAPGQEDPDLIDAGKELVTLRPGASMFNHADSFAIIRTGRLDLAVLGALQVSKDGDLANWMVEGQALGSIGGAMDLALGARAVYVLMRHVDKKGGPKIVERCTYPLTAQRCVDRIFTDLAVVDVTADGLVVREMAPGLSWADLAAATGAPLRDGRTAAATR